MSLVQIHDKRREIDHGPAIRIARAVKDMTQLDLAQRTGLSQGLIHQIEAGIRKPRPEQLRRIWDALST